MDEPRHILATLDAVPAGEQAVLATVVDVVGSGYRRPGARMLLTRGGGRAGGVSGGCLEADLMRRAFALTAQRPAVRRLRHARRRGTPDRQAMTPAARESSASWSSASRSESAADPSHPLAALRSLPDADEPLAAATVYRVDGSVGANVGDHAVHFGDF